MADLFGIDMRSLFASALGGQVFDSTLEKKVSGAYDASDPTAGSAKTTSSYPCKGLATKIISEFFDGDQRRRRFNGEAMILLGTLPTGVVPQAGDKITTVDPRTKNTLTATVTKVDVDPAGVQATCTVQT